MKKSITERLLKFYDSCFASDSELILYLFDQHLRHSAARQVSLRIKAGSKESVDEFIRLVNSPGWSDDLAKAEKNWDSEHGKALWRKMKPHLNLTGGRIKWGSLERKGAATDLLMNMAFGGPSFFLTFAPAMSDQKLTIMIQDGVRHDIDFEIPFRARAQLVAKNPAASARVFNLFCETVFERLIGVKLQKNSRNSDRKARGVFGKSYAYYGVVEVQGRGGLHLHALIWSALGPRLMASWAHLKDKRDIIEHELSKMVYASLDEGLTDEIDEMDRKPRVGWDKKEDTLWRKEGDEFKTWDDITAQADRVCACTCHHKHTFTCRKKKLKGFVRTLNAICRLVFPRGAAERTGLFQIKLPEGEDELITVEKLFAYLPFEHSENIDDQMKCVAFYEAIDEHESKEGWIEFAILHKDIIAKFGRFPHRNAMLGRVNTAAEEAWLQSSDQRFGTVPESDDSFAEGEEGA